MTIKTFSLVLALAFAWSACNNDTPQQSATPAEAAPATAPEGTMGTGLSPEPAPATALPAPATPAGTAPAPATAAAGGSAKLNPPHGQPGHVCGIPVGSPLDGSAASAAKPAQNQQPAAKPAATQPAGAATVAPGTNPPHGQPGHVCGVPVGSPLPKQ